MAWTARSEFRAGKGRTHVNHAAGPTGDMHGSRKEMKRGTVAAIKKQLGLE